ncbi:MAG TPA: EAL domain-containing protein [Actinomycetota bacterium]|jgi:diguanylate cyclase (GGDEF)-like protein|nr:EAL domain-containing protein [Actinomycetota bacterium]
MRLRTIPPVFLYVAAVTSVGLALLVALILMAAPGDFEVRSETLWLFASFAVLGELFPIKVARDGEEEEITTSTTFVFALLLSEGTVVAVVAQAVASLIGDVSRGKPLWKAAFNVSQTTISLAAAGAVLEVVAGVPNVAGPPFGTADLPAIMLGAGVFFLTNNFLAGAALALAQRVPIVRYLRDDFAFQALTSGVLLALSLIVVVAAAFSPLLVPLLALPVVAVYRSASTSLENARLVGRLEQSLVQLTEQAAKNQYQALHDALTDLPNRVLFHDRVQQAIRASQRERSSVAVMIMDLDHFKEINDTLGHHNGDRLLQQVGLRLRGVLRESDTVARLGGDEFGILLPQVSDAATATTVAAKVLKGLEDPLMVDGLALDITASIGIAICPQHGEDVDVLLRRADVAMYVAKASHSGYEVYTVRRDRYSPGRLALAGELRRALRDNELVLHFQPKVELRSGRVAGVEALLRWHHPRRGLLPPDEFVPLAEHTGLMRPLTLYVLDAALGECRTLHDLGLPVSVSVNLSARNLSDLGLPDEVVRLLHKWDIDPRFLELEITETSLMVDPARAMDVLARLSARRIRLSIDDFGTGYSSLAFLRQLPVDEIKIDKSFVMNMLSDENDAVIVRSTIDLGRNLGLRVVAEGVESEEIWDRLAVMGCDLAQGHYLAEPMPPEALAAWLQSTTADLGPGAESPPNGQAERPASPARDALPDTPDPSAISGQ